MIGRSTTSLTTTAQVQILLLTYLEKLNVYDNLVCTMGYYVVWYHHCHFYYSITDLLIRLSLFGML